MTLNAQRPWITPLVTGIFLLMAVTGSLMFFHADSGLNKTAHEWLGWAMVVGVLLHVALNINAFKRHLANTTGRWVLGASALLLALSFVPLGGATGGKPPFVAPVQALARSSLSTVADVAGIPVTELRARLTAAGVASQSDEQSIQDLVGKDMGQQMRTLGQVFASNTNGAAR
ncbi:DUF4405 domain-containing protein [Rhodoferax sp. U11-2br]|uniref:DUF4405 domain-containing protein n=1 Tax=Rhodoferax sp. U11-2br TaxID=2838878 RepID=UPI001BE60C83|nr:DUF4405 domain-containing protein [Rhodoferax sp. U11-2br]MBT3068254.1 DUF4405 domain-containing protein [Rhodoferax sp. U11-2br]